MRPQPERRRDVSGEPVIAASGLRIRYGTHEALAGVDLTVGRGETVAVVGPNGAGKTSALEILEGFRRRTGGQVTVLGDDPERAGVAWRARVGVVLQLSEPERHLTVEQCLRLYAGYYASPRPVRETLELVGLADRADIRGGRLSGGERRRLDVALALIGDPELLFLDEPTTGFDPAAKRAAWAAIDRLRRLGKTIVLTTHQMEEAEFLADRIVVLVRGRVAAEGTPATLGGRDRAPALIAFTLPPGASPPAQLAERLDRDGGRARLRTVTPLEDLEVLSVWARRGGHEVGELTVRTPSLEEMYLELTA